MHAERRLGVACLLAVLLVLTAPRSGHAVESPPTLLWTATSFADNVWGHNLAVGPDGHPVAAASVFVSDGTNVVSFFRVVKHDGMTGAVIWSITYDTGLGDQANGIAVGADGHPVVSGSSAGDDALVVKFDGADGGVLWATTFDGGATNSETAIGVAIGPDGNPVATGVSCVVNTASCQARMIKLDGANGAMLWNETYADISSGTAVAIGGDGHPVVSIALHEPPRPSRTVKYDGLTGAMVWDVSFPANGVGYAVAVGPDGHPVVAGAVCLPDCDFHTVKYDGATGAESWSAVFPFASDRDVGANGVAVGSDGHPVVAGNACGPSDGTENCDVRVLKYDGATGGQLWTAVFDNGGKDDGTNGVAIGPDGNPVLGALSCIFEPNVCDVTTMKTLLQYDTPAGAPVEVTLNGGTSAAGGVTVTYTSVVSAGSTTLTAGPTGPTPPAGFGLGDPVLFYDIATAASVTGLIQVCVNYTDRPVPAPETDLRLLHFEGGTWIDVTTSLDTVANVICGETSSLSPFVIATAGGSPLSSLGPASIWVGLKNSDDVGIRFDLRAEVYRNGTQLVGSGEAASVPGGSSGFNNAHQHSIALTPASGVTFASGDALSIKLLVRNACTGSGKNSGTARLWFNDSAATSRFDATLGAPVTYFLQNGSALATTSGPGPKKTSDVAAGAKCSPFKEFGTWSTTLP